MGLAFRFLTRYFFNTGQLLAQWEVDDGHAELRLLRVGDRSWLVFFKALSIESMIERYFISPSSPLA